MMLITASGKGAARLEAFQILRALTRLRWQRLPDPALKITQVH
jgi:hypothetical protein